MTALVRYVAPPLRPLLTLFGAEHPGRLPVPLLLTALETAAVAGVVTTVAFRLARSRS